MSVGVASLMERFLQNPGTSSPHIDGGQILLCSRRCLHDHPHQALEKEMLQYTPQNSCKRDHESGILETNSFTDVLFSHD